MGSEMCIRDRRDSGLARPSDTPDDHELRVVFSDQVELLRIDQRRDLGKMLVDPVPPTSAELLTALLRRRTVVEDPVGAAFSATKRERTGRRLRPLVIVLEEQSLRRLNPPESSSVNPQSAPCHNFAFNDPLPKLLVVLVSFGVAIEDPRDGRVTPCLLYTSPSPRDGLLSRMPSSA